MHDVDRPSRPAPEGLPRTIARKLRRLSGFQSEEVGPPTARRLDYPGHELYLYVTSRVEHKSRVHSCAKEPWTVSWIEEHAHANDVFYDIGANVGAYSLIAASRVGPSGRVVAIEPGYGSYAHLCDNVFLNGFEEVIIPVPLALGRQTGLGRFGYHSLYPGHARHGLGSNPALAKSPLMISTVLALTLDDAIAMFGLPQPHLVKLDVDGTEMDVLEGARHALESRACRSLVMEVEVPNTDDVVDWMRRRGFTLGARHQRERDGEPVGWWYGVFERQG